MTISYFQHDCYLNYRLDNQYTLSKKKEKKFRIWKGVKLKLPTPVFLGFPGGLDGKESTCNAADLGSTPGLGRSPGRGHGNPLQYSCLENPHGRKSLVGFSPWGCKESDTTEWLNIHETFKNKFFKLLRIDCIGGLKIPGSFKKQNLNFLYTSYLQ